MKHDAELYSIWIDGQPRPHSTRLLWEVARATARRIAKEEKVRTELKQGYNTPLMYPVYFDGRHIR